MSPLGLTITGGVSSQNLYRPRDPGLYILKLTERGDAYENGTLQTGDRILAVSFNPILRGGSILIGGGVCAISSCVQPFCL